MTDSQRSPDPRPGRSAGSRRRASAQKIAAERQRRRTLMIRVGLAAAALIVIAIVAIVIVSRRQSDTSTVAGVQSYSYPGGQHTEGPVDYAENPPVGGPHNPVWQNCGYYASPVANENAVHSLEHGTVWITYSPDLPQEQVDRLKALATSQSYILVSPYDGLPSPVVVSAWDHQLQLDSVDDPRLDAFIREYRLSPKAPEPGASCTGGTAETR